MELLQFFGVWCLLGLLVGLAFGRIARGGQDG
jgi:hypothetical protein